MAVGGLAPLRLQVLTRLGKGLLTLSVAAHHCVQLCADGDTPVYCRAVCVFPMHCACMHLRPTDTFKHYRDKSLILSL